MKRQMGQAAFWQRDEIDLECLLTLLLLCFSLLFVVSLLLFSLPQCHRIENDIYAVNSLAFHHYGTFATAGSDGVYTFWSVHEHWPLWLAAPYLICALLQLSSLLSLCHCLCVCAVAVSVVVVFVGTRTRSSV